MGERQYRIRTWEEMEEEIYVGIPTEDKIKLPRIVNKYMPEYRDSGIIGAISGWVEMLLGEVDSEAKARMYIERDKVRRGVSKTIKYIDVE